MDNEGCEICMERKSNKADTEKAALIAEVERLTGKLQRQDAAHVSIQNGLQFHVKNLTAEVERLTAERAELRSMLEQAVEVAIEEGADAVYGICAKAKALLAEAVRP